MENITVEEFCSILLSNPKLPNTMPSWFPKYFSVSTMSNPSTSWFLYKWLIKE